MKRTTSINIGNSDTVLLTSGRLLRIDIQDAIDIDIKAGTEFCDMPWCRWNSTEIKFSQEVVILGSCSFTLVHSKADNSLVVIPRGETLLHLGRNWCVPWNYKTHFTICNIHSKGERCDIQKCHLINLTIQDGSLNSSTVGNSLILVNTLAKFLTMEEIPSTNKNYVMDTAPVQLRISQTTFNRLQTVHEQIYVKFIKSGTRNGSVKINTLKQTIYSDVGLKAG
ncbi:hypothetical protein RJ639_004564 [Escallonia herrerae]|uniref:Uncharacterized protein n=1 Tax=Escallonia herrerae TaxID=1293975 RepID=A0AA89AZ93_9ASTE|nr:hypothetical protein RJ639_004564 [Escallonia herrerae]